MKIIKPSLLGLGIALLCTTVHAQEIRSIEISAFYSEDEPNRILKFHSGELSEAAFGDQTNKRFIRLAQADLFAIRNMIAGTAASRNIAQGELIIPTVITIEYSTSKKTYAVRDTTSLSVLLKNIRARLYDDTGELDESLNFIARNIGLQVPEENMVRRARRRAD
jgi:hypothetical protein